MDVSGQIPFSFFDGEYTSGSAYSQMEMGTYYISGTSMLRVKLNMAAGMTRNVYVEYKSGKALFFLHLYRAPDKVCTVLVIIKLKKFVVALRLRCGSYKLIFSTIFHNFSLNLRMSYIVWSLLRRRVTRRLTRLQTMCNILNYCKVLRCVAVAERLRLFFQFT